MRKVLNRIFAILMLLITIFIVCYIFYTCKKVSAPATPYETLEKSSYKSKNGTILAFTGENIWYFTANKTYVCVKENYENGQLKISSDEQTFTFQVIDEKTIYDNQKKEFLRRGDSS